MMYGKIICIDVLRLLKYLLLDEHGNNLKLINNLRIFYRVIVAREVGRARKKAQDLVVVEIICSVWTISYPQQCLFAG